MPPASYPLTGPNKTSGVYALRNRTTKQIYIGQSTDLRRRYAEWRGIFGSKLGATNQALNAAVQSTNQEDWDFVILQEAAEERLNELERNAIAKTKAAIGDLCLNGLISRLPREVRPMPGSTPLSEVRDEDGNWMTHQQIAARCGVTRQAIKKRLGRYRQTGKTSLTIADLL